jgi:VWFA-related protein
MRFRQLGSIFCLASVLVFAQEAPAPGNAVIRTETRVVLVDAVVTDKKGNYVHDLTQKDFKVFEDNRPQTITSFSSESDASGPNKNQRRYMVLFFDNSTLDFGQQAIARKAAVQFINANAGPNRVMSIVNYTGSLQITQNFTDDVDKLKAAASGIKGSAVASNETASAAGPSISAAEIAYGVNTGILALRSLVKNLANVPGRKSLILLTGGFRLVPEIMSDMEGLIDVCNKSNVAIYPIDVRGLVASNWGNPYSDRPVFRLASFSVPSVAFFQHPGGGGGGGGIGGGGGGTSSGGGRGGSTGGGTSGSGSGSGRGGSTGSSGGTSGSGKGGGGGSVANNGNLNQLNNNPLNNPRNIIPTFPTSATDNQQPLYMLASGTGGFVIVNTNDLAGGLEKIGQEQNEYYLIGYTPTESEEGSCHTLKVKVERSGDNVRARSGYCNVKPQDVLAGDPTEKDLEKLAAGAAPGTLKASMQVPFFYTSPNTVRADVAMEIPTEGIKFDKKKGKYHAVINILGITYRGVDNTVAAKFSDSVKLDFENKKEMEAFLERPSVHYEKEFDAAPGNYMLKVVFNSGQGFGKLERPLDIDSGDAKHLRVSSLVFSRDFHRIAEGDTALDAALIEDRTPLTANGMQFIPSGTNHFTRTETVALFAQIYEGGLMGPNPPKELATAVQMKVLDPKTMKEVQDSGLMRTPTSAAPGSALIPLALKVPVDKLAAGSYVLELSVQDIAGNKTKRTAPFEVH